MAELVDQPKKVREGEELDGPKLEAYLKSKVPGLEGTMRVAQFPGARRTSRTPSPSTTPTSCSAVRPSARSRRVATT